MVKYYDNNSNNKNTDRNAEKDRECQRRNGDNRKTHDVRANVMKIRNSKKVTKRSSGASSCGIEEKKERERERKIWLRTPIGNIKW